MNSDAAAFRSRLQAWLRASDDYQKLFEEGPIGKILSRDAAGNYLVSDEDVPKVLFNDRPDSAESIRAYLRANGDPLPLEDYGAHLMRSSGAVKTDGTLDLAVLASWEARFSSALSVLPGLRSKIEMARNAQTALEEAIARHKAAKEAFLQSPALLFAEHDPMTATEKLFMLPDSAEAMRSLLHYTDANQNVVDGLQRAVTDYILQRIGVTEERASEYLEFIARHEQALIILFGEPKMETFRNVAADLRRSIRCTQVEPEPRGGRFPTSAPRRGWLRLFGKG